MDSTVRDLVWKMNMIALKSEDSGLGVVLPPVLPAADNRLAEIQALRSSSSPWTGRRSSRVPTC